MKSFYSLIGLFSLLILPAISVSAQTAAEQAELAAAAAPPSGQSPTGSTLGGLACPIGTSPVSFYFSDFEANDGGWTGGGAAPWEWGAPGLGVFEICDSVPAAEPTGAFSGTNVWATNLDGCHANSGSASLLSQTFDFSALPAPIQLSWWNWYEVFVPFDMAELIVNGGAPLFEVTTTAATGVYVQETVDLSAFAGNPSVTIDFRLFATTVVNRLGWYIDDVAIEYCGVADADVDIEKAVDIADPLPGATVIYTLTVTNNGPADATGVVVTDTLPAGLTYVSDDCGGLFADPTFTWNVGNLGNGASAVCNVTATVDGDAAGTLVNNATVSADNSDPDTSNNQADVTIVVGGGPGVLEIPTVGGIGLLLLGLLLALAARLVLRRQSSHQRS
jgi:uncharacterized repeat protein (TIGR01451 family)